MLVKIRADVAAVERMIVGLPVSFEDSRQQLVYEVATALISSQYVPKGLYDRGQRSRYLTHDALIHRLDLRDWKAASGSI
ncbi:MAG: hypothetical protein JO270_13010 [Acidobacteriaceae bacterium]|nr:hypothetical protein [Acidobacteriaceae bacterium]